MANVCCFTCVLVVTSFVLERCLPLHVFMNQIVFLLTVATMGCAAWEGVCVTDNGQGQHVMCHCASSVIALSTECAWKVLNALKMLHKVIFHASCLAVALQDAFHKPICRE